MISMDIISIRQDKRDKQIDKIINSIREAYYNGEEIDKKKIVLSIMANLSLAKRTAQEYLDIAIYKGNIDIDNMNKTRQTNLNKFSGAAYNQVSSISNDEQVVLADFKEDLPTSLSPDTAEVSHLVPQQEVSQEESAERLLYELTGIKPSIEEIDDYLIQYSTTGLSIFKYAEALRNKHGVRSYTNAM